MTCVCVNMHVSKYKLPFAELNKLKGTQFLAKFGLYG